jgi:hypothetical protein
MDNRGWVRAYRTVFALMTLIALGYQLYHSRNANPDYKISNFFSFFTVQSNIFAALVLLYAAWKSSSGDDHPRFDFIRGAAVLYMATTGVVYGLLLSGYEEELQTALFWINNIVHKIFPLVLVADWFIVRPRSRIEIRQAAWWLAYPLAYCAYSLVRGPIVDWYPYPFLDPRHDGGYWAVALYCVIIALGIALLAALFAYASWRANPKVPEISAASRDLGAAEAS